LKLTVLIPLLLLLAAVLFVNARRRAAAERRATEAAQARARAARRPQAPAVSNNVKGVTASQTIQPLRNAGGSTGRGGAGGDDERAA
jgi:hypothetical protein